MIREYAIIENDTIVNKILIDESDTDSIELFKAVPLLDRADIGWTIIDGVWTDPNPTAADAPPFELTQDEIDLILQELMNETSPGS